MMMTKSLYRYVAPAALLLLTGCMTHVAGVVLDSDNQPIPTAVLTVGRPDSNVDAVKHPVDANGHFDFKFPMIDNSWVYVWNGQGVPAMNYRKIDPTNFSTNMVIHFTR
jgi:hypothetical protein